MRQLLPRRMRQIQLSWLITYADLSHYIFCRLLPFFLVILVSLFYCMAFDRGRWRFIEWLYVIIKVFIIGLCPVFTEHKPTCCDIILVTLVCFWGSDWWRWVIEPLYVIIKKFIVDFCSESTIGWCHLLSGTTKFKTSGAENSDLPSPRLTQTKLLAFNLFKLLYGIWKRNSFFVCLIYTPKRNLI